MTTDKQDSRQIHRRAVRMEILLPFAGGLIGIIVLVVIAALAGRTPTSGIANTLLTVLLLCPMAICLLPIYLLLVVAVIGMNRAHDAIAQPLHQLQELSLKLRQQTVKISDRAANTTIHLNARFAVLDKLIFSLFDRPAHQEDDHE